MSPSEKRSLAYSACRLVAKDMHAKFTDGTEQDIDVYTCWFLMPVDLVEAQKVLGVTTCPACNVNHRQYDVVHKDVAQLRTVDEVKKTILRSMRKKGGEQVLRDESLSQAHLELLATPCPFFEIPWFFFDSLPPDCLHEVYVEKMWNCVSYHQPSSPCPVC